MCQPLQDPTPDLSPPGRAPAPLPAPPPRPWPALLCGCLRGSACFTQSGSHPEPSGRSLPLSAVPSHPVGTGSSPSSPRRPSSNPLGGRTTAYCPPAHVRTLGCLSSPPVDDAAVPTHGQACVGTRSRLLGPTRGGGFSGNSVFNLLRNASTVFQAPRTFPRSRQHRTSVPRDPQPPGTRCRHAGGRSPPGGCEKESYCVPCALPGWLVALSISPRAYWPFMPLFWRRVASVLYIFWLQYETLTRPRFADNFSHFVGCLFAFLIVS